MKNPFAASIALVALLNQCVTWSQETVFSPDLQVHIIGADDSGNPTVREWVPGGVGQNRNLSNTLTPVGAKLDYPNYHTDSILPAGNLSSGRRSSRIGGAPAILELVIVVDKEFGDLFSHNYYQIVDYLTVYFWDINIRFKSLTSVDLSLRVNGLLIMESAKAQPFIENARASDGRTDNGRILGLYKNWIYEQRGWLVRHDVAPLMTGSKLESGGGGLAHARGACWLDNDLRFDYGTCVWGEGADWHSITVGAHEIAHTVGAPHDDDPNARCLPPYGFIMSGGNDKYRYFFSACSDKEISGFVNSDSAACLRRIDGHSTTPMHPNFSSPKAPSMLEQCKKRLNNPNAWIDDVDTYDCKQMRCKRRDDSGPNIWTYFFGVLENSICAQGTGRCFRGRCRLLGKLIRNEGDGTCIGTTDMVGHMIPAHMINCPSSKDITPLNSIEILAGPGDQRLATPYTEEGNTESGDRCMYTGYRDGDAMWTDRCSDNTWQGWEFRGVGGANFLLVHKVTGRCAVPDGGVGSWIKTYACNSGNPRMLWSLRE